MNIDRCSLVGQMQAIANIAARRQAKRVAAAASAKRKLANRRTRNAKAAEDSIVANMSADSSTQSCHLMAATGLPTGAFWAAMTRLIDAGTVERRGDSKPHSYILTGDSHD